MTIRLNPAATFTAKVTLAQASGTAPEVAAQFTYRMLTAEELVAVFALVGAGKYSRARRWWERLKLAARLRRWPNLADVLDIIVAGWEGFDVPYSRGAMVLLLKAFPGAGLSILATYAEQRQESRIKN